MRWAVCPEVPGSSVRRSRSRAAARAVGPRVTLAGARGEQGCGAPAWLWGARKGVVEGDTADSRGPWDAPANGKGEARSAPGSRGEGGRRRRVSGGHIQGAPHGSQVGRKCPPRIRRPRTTRHGRTVFPESTRRGRRPTGSPVFRAKENGTGISKSRQKLPDGDRQVPSPSPRGARGNRCTKPS